MRQYIGERNECLRCCVASILDLDLEQVPCFNLEEDWAQVFYEFMQVNKKDVLIVSERPSEPHIEIIAIGDEFHARVCAGAEILMDPLGIPLGGQAVEYWRIVNA